MEHRYLLSNGVIFDGDTFINGGCILVNGRKIELVENEVPQSAGKVEIIDLEGRIVIPGLVNPHSHLYSSLSTGLKPKGSALNFPDILANLWWPLDAAHDEKTTYFSAVAGVIDAVRHGVTCIFDHHASMSFVEGSLSAVERAFRLAGIKGVLCFETSDRTGAENASRHVEENLNFIRSHVNDPEIKGMLGFHANLTLSNAVLAKISESLSGILGEVPIHIHCGEAREDLDYCRKAGYQGPAERLYNYGLLTPKSILAHCIHLSEADYEIIHKVAPFVVCNPESNANNRVGKMDRTYIPSYLLGTDGMSFDMISTLRSHYLLGGGVSEDLDKLKEVFFSGPRRLLSEYFPNTGRFRTGMDADITVLDYIPATVINRDNIMSHLIFGAKGGCAFMTIANGNILFRDGKITFTFEHALKKQMREAADELHGRFYG